MGWADWENVNDHSQGFGKYVAVQDDAVNTDGILQVRYYGHLNSIAVKLGQKVSCTDILGEMGSTGRSHKKRDNTRYGVLLHQFADGFMP